MASEMVERVAKAIWEVVAVDKKLIPEKWENYKAQDWYRLLAYTAIEALRNPTQAMIDAGFSSGCDQRCDGEDGNWHEWREYEPEEVWSVMITAALKA